MGRSDKQGGARRWNGGTPLFSKLPAGTRRRAEPEAKRDKRAHGAAALRVGRSWAARGLLVVLVASSSWSGPSARGLLGGLSVEKRSVERPVRRSSQSVGSRAWHEGRGREAPLCQLCRARLRIRVESAGESSPAPWKVRVSRGYPSCRGERRHDAPIKAPRGCR